jgi:hypothetical protein
MIKKISKVFILILSIFSQWVVFAQTTVYFQNENPESSALFDLKYYSLGDSAPAGSWFYLKGNVNLNNPLILAYPNTPDTSTTFNFYNNGVEQITLFELSAGEYRTGGGSMSPFKYFAIWTGSGTWDCILVSNSPTATCQFSPSVSDTLASLRPNAFALRNAFNLQSAKIAQGLTYDCTVYNQKNICVSFAGSKSDGKGFDATTGALIIAHKPTNNFRFGGYIDQSFGSSTSGGLTTKNGNPGFGAFAVWSQNADGSGVQVRTAAIVGKVDIETTRVTGEDSSAEAGFGKSNIKSQGFSLEVSKDYALSSMWTARPYVGYRKTTNKRAEYTETDAVVFPLTYGSLKQNTDTVTAGATFAHTLSAKTTMFLTAGIEHDLKNSIGRYAATSPGIDDIDSIDMGSNKTKIRPTVSFALNHDIDKTQRIGVSLTHRKEAFASGSTTSAFLQYSKGF